MMDIINHSPISGVSRDYYIIRHKITGRLYGLNISMVNAALYLHIMHAVHC